MSKTMTSIMAELEQKPASKIAPVDRIPFWRILGLAAQSSVRFVELIASGSMHILPNRLGEFYRVDGEGTYRIFRETVSYDGEKGPLTVLVVGFRLRFIGSNRLLHWAFQRICILTTPIWSGFRGYRVKLWMVDPQTMNYLGIYQWAGEKNATSYVDWLASLLLPLSTKSSVWYELHPHKRLDEYLVRHKARSDPTQNSPLIP